MPDAAGRRSPWALLCVLTCRVALRNWGARWRFSSASASQRMVRDGVILSRSPGMPSFVANSCLSAQKFVSCSVSNWIFLEYFRHRFRFYPIAMVWCSKMGNQVNISRLVKGESTGRFSLDRRTLGKFLVGSESLGPSGAKSRRFGVSLS